MPEDERPITRDQMNRVWRLLPINPDRLEQVRRPRHWLQHRVFCALKSGSIGMINFSPLSLRTLWLNNSDVTGFDMTSAVDRSDDPAVVVSREGAQKGDRPQQRPATANGCYNRGGYMLWLTLQPLTLKANS
ncbi:hypothetical protein QUB68_26265 [Microcoleus sp. A006_D1]|uniref:hypothetical protein n=1 Tax=Microcoleus sp. A006_D1 TaxID=3055267 RepID=UPI002FD4782A